MIRAVDTDTRIWVRSVHLSLLCPFCVFFPSWHCSSCEYSSVLFSTMTDSSSDVMTLDSHVFLSAQGVSSC